jgi:phosphoglycerate dehydrogenase-like enzyme
MPPLHASRRDFIATVAATGTAAFANFTPLQSLANVRGENNVQDPHRQINIVSTIDLSADDQKRIKSASDNINLIINKDLKAQAIEDAEIVFGWLDPAGLSKAKKLKWMQVWSAGVENMPKEIITHPVVLTNMQRIFAPVIAETAISLLLSLTRGLVQFAIPNFNQKKWVGNTPDNLVLEDLYNKTIGIVGMGGIGSETARRLHYGFNMHVVGTDAKPLPRPEFVDELHDPSWLMEMVPKVDVLMSAAPLTKETKGMFDEKVFSKMKPSAYFINVSRGGLVKQDELIKALKNKTIRGAGLDVATPEPLPAESELWTCPNLVITPHNSTEAPIRDERMIALVAENVRRYASGLPLMNVVDKEKGY